MTGTETGEFDRWPVRGAGVVGGLATALLTVLVVPAGLPLSLTLGAMAVVGLGTAVQAARQPLPSAAGAVVAGVAAVLLVVAGVSAGLQALFAAPPSGAVASLVRQGSMVLATLGLLAGVFAAAVSFFFWKRSRKRLDTSY